MTPRFSFAAHLPLLYIRNLWQILKNFLGAIYDTSGVFPYDFYWGYADWDVITLKKVL
jgi:hypothetical protein